MLILFDLFKKNLNLKNLKKKQITFIYNLFL